MAGINRYHGWKSIGKCLKSYRKKEKNTGVRGNIVQAVPSKE
jgi:hypothetical protein